MPQRILSDTALFDVMVATAVAAGRVIHDLYRTGFEVQTKADQSPVTNADQAAEALILACLSAAEPHVPIVAEEQVAAGLGPASGNDTWGDHEFFLVDPLDGTKEFIRRSGDFTVNIALIRDRVPVLGVVYAPARSCLYAGNVSTRTAFRSSQDPDSASTAQPHDIHVRPVPAQGLVAVSSRSHSIPETDAYLAQLPVADRVSIGSSLKFCLVAGAEADLYPRLGPTMEWDTAAGHAVLLAAGGQVYAPGGSPLRYGKPAFRNSFFIASGPFIPPPLTAG